MEIYKDEVCDLVIREHAPKLPVRADDSGMVIVTNLSRIPISSVDEFGQIYKWGKKKKDSYLPRHGDGPQNQVLYG